MLTIISAMAVGIIAGFFLRHKKIRFLDEAMLVIIWLLLFLLGVEAGSDDRIVKWIASLGLEALVITIGGVAGSSVCAMLLWKYSRQDKRGKETEK